MLFCLSAPALALHSQSGAPAGALGVPGTSTGPAVCNTEPRPTKDLELPPNLAGYAIVTQGDATIGAHHIDKSVAVGGTFGDSTSDASSTVGSAPDSDLNYLNDMSAGVWDFNSPVCDVGGKGIPFDWAQLTKIAASAASSGKTLDDYRVITVDQGGTYDGEATSGTEYTMDDFAINGMIGEPNGSKTLVIFKGGGTVVLGAARNADGKSVGFGPSVLAPNARVLLDGNVGVVDGTVVAKSMSDFGENRGANEVRGNSFAGRVSAGSPPPQAAKPKPPTQGTTFDDPHVKTLSGSSYFMHGVGVFEYASSGGVESQVYMCPFAPCTEKMMDKGECLTFIVAIGIRTRRHKIVLRDDSVWIDGTEMQGTSWEGGLGDVPMRISPVGQRVRKAQVSRVNHKDLRGCRPDGNTENWLWHNCTKAGWDIVTPDLTLNIGVLGPFEEGWLKEEVSSRTFNLGVSQTRDPEAVRGIINGDRNGFFSPAGEEYETGKSAAANVNHLPQVTAQHVRDNNSIFPMAMKALMDAQCGAGQKLRLALAVR